MRVVSLMIIFALAFLLPSMSLGQVVEDVKSDAQIDFEVNKALREQEAEAIPTDSVFEARRCQIYAGVVLQNLRDAGKSETKKAEVASKDLDVWNTKVEALMARKNSPALSDDFVLNYSGLGFLTSSSEEGADSAGALFGAELNRCRSLASTFYSNLISEIKGKDK